MTETPPPQSETKPLVLDEPSRGFEQFSLGLMILALFIGCASLYLSALAFTSFLGDGRTLLGVFESFLVCFGIGAVVYIPALIIFLMARHVRGRGPGKRIGFSSILLSLPFWSYCSAALLADYPFRIWLVSGLVFGVMMLVWGIANILKA